MPWRDARQLAYAAADPLPPVDLPLAEAIGHVLAVPLAAPCALPPFDTAAMDGFAVAGEGPWRVARRQLAVDPAPPPLERGTACEIATGAAVPPGTTAVLPYEDAARQGDLVGGDVAAGRHIRRRGEECRAGEQLVGPGAVVTPPGAGLAAAVGLDCLRVHRRPVVRVLVSGDELADTGPPRPGRIRDALGPQLPALVTGFRGTVAGLERVPDRPESVAAALAAAADADVVVTTGATSRGPTDHLPRVLADAGARVLVRGVACRPGHPQLLARLPDGRWLVGLPGNPLAALVGALTLLAPLLARLGGHPPPASRTAQVGPILKPHPELTKLVPVVLDLAGHGIPLDFGGAAMLRGVARADGLAVVPAGTEPQETVEVLPIGC